MTSVIMPVHATHFPVNYQQMMEWWYQSAEERMSAPTVYPPPPPPPPPKVAKEGIPLPADKTICPLCSQKRANPSAVSVSGFVFCYTCVFKYVSQVKNLLFTGYQVIYIYIWLLQLFTVS